MILTATHVWWHLLTAVLAYLESIWTQLPESANPVTQTASPVQAKPLTVYRVEVETSSCQTQPAPHATPTAQHVQVKPLPVTHVLLETASSLKTQPALHAPNQTGL